MMCDKHVDCNCLINTKYGSAHQTLDELDFSRGIWTAALDGSYDDVINCLEKKGINPDVLDSSGYTALHYASRNGHTSVCQLLLEKGASPNVQTRSGGVTPLHRAAYCGHTDTLRLLLTSGADPNIYDADGMLPIHKAAERGQALCVQQLLEAAPASRSVRDKKGRTPVSCVQEHCDEVKQLFEDVP
ncbi:ankyrin repeat domain-containing protein 39-like [Mya arenaria]|uniref:ankyrin repeat domain-containing protein 39-like n=1 Tax=Mya arenaria TaxID=6604 RepID=UPI0022E4A8DF|nr:ankyrin repeat domain-containing protein 39-like [Mya arenaria]